MVSWNDSMTQCLAVVEPLAQRCFSQGLLPFSHRWMHNGRGPHVGLKPKNAKVSEFHLRIYDFMINDTLKT